MTGYVLFAIDEQDLKPCYLELKAYASTYMCVSCSDIKEATVYPTYEAAEYVKKRVIEDNRVKFVEVFDTEGNRCSAPSANISYTLMNEDEI